MTTNKSRPKALPTIVWQYGCRPPEDETRVIEQMRLAHRYRNALCEVELHRRAAASAIVHQDELAAMRAEIEGLDQQVSEIYEMRRKCNQELRRKTSLSADDRATVAAIKERLKPLRASYREAKAAAYDSPTNKASLAAIDEAAHAAAKEARRIASYEWGLYWGTYLLIEADAMKFRKGAPPRFRGFRGDGQIAVQIQSNAESRLTVEDVAEDGGDSHFHIRPLDAQHAEVDILIGGTDPCKRINGTNPPIYAKVRATIHRPLPEGAHVTWVRLVRKKTGTNFKWYLQFVLARAEGWAKSHGDGTVGIDDRYDTLVDGTIRVARWAGSDGDSGEFYLPSYLVRAMRHKPDLQSIHDDKTNIARAALVAWIKEIDEAKTVLPEWFTEATKTLALWKGAARLAGLIIRWRDNRFNGDEGIFAQMETYRKDAKHLFNWFAHESQKCINRRRDLYRNWARQLARKYGVAGVRKRAPAVLTDVTARHVATSEFRATLKQGGLEVVELPAGEGDDSAVEILRAVRCRENTPDLSTVMGQEVTADCGAEGA